MAPVEMFFMTLQIFTSGVRWLRIAVHLTNPTPTNPWEWSFSTWNFSYKTFYLKDVKKILWKCSCGNYILQKMCQIKHWSRFDTNSYPRPPRQHVLQQSKIILYSGIIFKIKKIKNLIFRFLNRSVITYFWINTSKKLEDTLKMSVFASPLAFFLTNDRKRNENAKIQSWPWKSLWSSHHLRVKIHSWGRFQNLFLCPTPFCRNQPLVWKV